MVINELLTCGKSDAIQGGSLNQYEGGNLYALTH
jgi:hypothetical protein